MSIGPVPEQAGIRQDSPVVRTKSRKGTITSKIGKIFGVSKNEDLLNSQVQGQDKAQATSQGQDKAPPSPPTSASSSCSSSVASSRYHAVSSPRASGVSAKLQSGNGASNGASNGPGNGPAVAAASNGTPVQRSASPVPSASSASINARFVVHEDGSHEHSLKNAKRQEKLGSMIKNMLGAQKLRGEAKSAVPDILIKSMKSGDPPSLFSGLIKQVNANASGTAFPYSGATQIIGAKRDDQPQSSRADIDEATTVNPLHNQSSVTFAEKYGRCQEVIGKGSFGTVRICHKKNLKGANGEILYAVKEFRRRPTENPAKYSKRLTAEFCISSSLKHTNIIDTLDLFQDAKGDYCEVMEYCSGGDLFTLIIAAGKLEYQEADCFFKQLITGVVYMHNMGVCHRDLKPENLLLTHDGVLKITDFGNSECFRMAWEKEIHLSGGICGSSPYIAPEEYTQDEFDPRAVDIWACGVIYMAMRTGRQLWATAQKEDEFYMKYLKGRKNAAGYDPIEKLKRARCRNVIYSILDPVPSRRLNGNQILNSEWGREIVCCHQGHPVR